MLIAEFDSIVIEQEAISSFYLKRYVIIDLYIPNDVDKISALPLLLINDGQNLEEMKWGNLVNRLHAQENITPFLSIGIHTGKERMNEYGIAGIPDYEGRGAKARLYTKFIIEELLPFIRNKFNINHQASAFIGFSLGGLSALDLVWNNPKLFSTAGVFSGSLWWRSKPLGDDYNDATDRIMHQQVRKSGYRKGLRFYFTTGSLDEVADRNNNGVIDSIDDTLDIISELKQKGYKGAHEITYINYEDGRHDVPTWGRAMPEFIKWWMS